MILETLLTSTPDDMKRDIHFLASSALKSRKDIKRAFLATSKLNRQTND